MFHFHPFFSNFTHSFYQIQSSTSIPVFNHSFQPQFCAQNPQTFNQQQKFQNSSNLIPFTTSDRLQPTNSDFIKVFSDQPVCRYSQKQQMQSSSNDKNLIQDSKLKKLKPIQKIRHKQPKRKLRGQKKDKAYVAKQYKKQEPSINCRYIQKNFQLNIINQVFSFLWSEQKSHDFVKRFFKDNIKLNLYFEYMKIVRKFSKRYINKEYLKNLCDYQNHHIAYKMVSKNIQKLEYLSIGEFSRCIRHLIFIYLNQLCPLAVLTSKKLREQIWIQHLKKCRFLRKFMFCNLSGEDFQKVQIQKNSENKKMVEWTSQEQLSLNIK